MDEPGEEGSGGPAAAGAMPEGGESAGRGALNAGAVQGLGLQAFRGQSGAATNLDLLLDMNEPELLMREIVTRAGERMVGGRARSWGAIVDGGRKILDTLEALNAPANRA